MQSMPVTERIDREAREWCILVADTPLPDEKRIEFEHWLAADPRHRQAFDSAMDLWQGLSAVAPSQLSSSTLNALHETGAGAGKPKQSAALPQTLRQPLARYGAVGMAMVATILCAVLVFRPTLERDGHRYVSVHETSRAEVKTVALPDGSEVSLGAQTNLSFDFKSDHRVATLILGEAYFDIAPDDSRPFFVTAGDTSVRVVGTVFEVQRLGNDVVVAVAEGLVDVAEKDAVLASTGEVGSDKLLRLTPGQQVTRSAGSGFGTVQPINIASIGSWRAGRLTYVRSPLSEIISDANRYHDGYIYIEDDVAAQLTLNITYETQDVSGLLTTIAEALPIHIGKNDLGHTVIWSKKSKPTGAQ